jgi:hypothetical protein
MDQLRTNIASVHVELSKEVLDAIEYTNRIYTYPCP